MTPKPQTVPAQSVHLQLPADLLAQVERARGDVPRNAWIRRAIQQRLDRDVPSRVEAWAEGETIRQGDTFDSGRGLRKAL